MIHPQIMGIGKTIIDMKLKENYQVTILAGKEDGTNSTATVTTEQHSPHAVNRDGMNTVVT